MFLGSVAGLHKLLMALITMVFGPYINFMSKAKWLRHMFTFKDESENSENKEEVGFVVSRMYLTWLYIVNRSSIKCLFTCCKKSKRELKTLKMI